MQNPPSFDLLKAGRSVEQLFCGPHVLVVFRTTWSTEYGVHIMVAFVSDHPRVLTRVIELELNCCVRLCQSPSLIQPLLPGRVARLTAVMMLACHFAV